MADETGGRLPQGVKNLLRDVAVAFLIVAIVMAALFAYARVWPPMVVIESSSMQHSPDESFLGVIDTGDIVLVQSAPGQGDVTTYVEGRAGGHRTYQDFGDVIIFHKYGDADTTPVIHRAMMFVVWNETAGGFDVPSLLSLPPSLWDSSRPTPHGLQGSDWVLLRDVGFRSLDIRFTFSRFTTIAGTALCPAPCSGFLTMGDNNAAGSSGYDQWVVKEGWVLGRARGEVPWFGLLKLVVAGPLAWGDSRAPANSWLSLTIAIILLIAGPLALDIAISVVSSKKSGGRGNPGDPEDKSAK